MHKAKTKKAIVKRVKVTGTGKVLRYPPGSGHLKSRKSPARLRRMRKAVGLSKPFERVAKKLLGTRA
jgi:large subunit ribosomal protein L35